MARKKSQEAVIENGEISTELAESIDQAHKTGVAIIEAAKMDNKTATAFINQRIGRKQAYGMVSKLLTVADLVDLQNIKDSKGYKGFIAFKDGNPLTISTWDEYCEVVEGRSRQSIDNELLNLNALGPELFESMRTVGIGPGTMRQIRQLPEDKIALLEQVKNTTDKDDIAEIIEALIDRNTKEKTELAKKVEELTADSESKELVIADKDKKINEQAKKLTRLKKLSPDDVANEYRVEISKLENEIEEQIRVNFRNALHELSEYANDNGLEGDHQTFINAQANMINKALVDVAAELGITLEATAAVEWE